MGYDPDEVPRNTIELCNRCKHIYAGTFTCKMFPDGIPKEILDGIHDHRKPFLGDRGVQFEENPEYDAWLRRYLKSLGLPWRS